MNGLGFSLCFADAPRGTRAWLVEEALEALGEEGATPRADRRLGDPQRRGEVPVRAALGRPQHDVRPDGQRWDVVGRRVQPVSLARSSAARART